MPRELPGFYFDSERNRYFPLSSRSPPPSAPLSVATPTQFNSKIHEPPLKRRKFNVKTSQQFPYCLTYRERERVHHDLQCTQIASTSKSNWSQPCLSGSITAFCSTELDGQRRQILGDSYGWISTKTDDNDWTLSYNLHPESEVSSISASKSHVISTGFGTSPRLALEDLTTTGARRTTLLTPKNVNDIRCSHLHNTSLVLGASKKAVFFPDIDVAPRYQTLNTQSDVFTVERQNNSVYAGARDGRIHLFDIRKESLKGESIIDRRKNTSVVHLQVFHEHQLLASHMDGNLSSFDIRFYRSSTPCIDFPGHVNQFTPRLGLAIDPAQEFLFAAGQDNRIRGWSLRDGCPLPLDQKAGTQNPFYFTFPTTISTLQVTEEQEGDSLWVASSKGLHRYYLGQGCGSN